MRNLALAILAAATILIGAPGAAQTYDPSYPVCLHVYGRGANYYECRAQCVVNPYFASAEAPAVYRRHRRVY